MAALEISHAVILGIVEGITEYLPVSSTGHLIIASALLGLDEPPERKAAVDAFNIVIQGGAILAVLGLYWPRVLQMLRGLTGRDAVGLKLFTNLVIAFLPAAFLGVLLDPMIEKHLFYPGPVIAALAIGGVIMIALGPWQRRQFESDGAHYVDIDHLSWKAALFVGLLQCLAMWPGTSRSMATIVGGMLIGLRPKQAAEFSFLLGLPTLGGACVYKLGKNLAGEGPNMFELLGAAPLAVGIITATISAALAVKWLVGYLSRHGVSIFGWYRIALSIVLAFLVWRGVLQIAPPTEDAAAETTLEATG